ncbi:type VI secretion protein IcmF [Lysobacter enzymogenes]|uniref:Type VI secretion protein IcmF n=1 Tax=Lysobacter enzymogenes TaxID=69 RepID=A0A0S2DBM7_LYSEN|nr:type VI secretion system membrane subunit TssM [Lysobacter enzymogenes]ALN55789.1 type VI secretion protein IcmF [Lysobacter enzymogenes]
MSRLRYFLTDYRVIAALGVFSVGAVAYFGADKLKTVGGWILVLAALALLVWLAVWIVRRVLAARAAKQLDAMVQQQADQAVAASKPAARADVEQLRERMAEAVKAIKSSKLGLLKGSAALYELPWYTIIGNPAAGKSTAILNSGLRFPFEDNRSNVIQGLGGTRNCDWYFTTEGIVLDTAGRYTVSAEDRLEWLTFLDLLKKHRPRAPLNGVIIAASIAELSGSKPEFAIELAKNLRQRVQELTERLEVFVPVYVVFTKADLIAGFADFFQGLDPAERENTWGATLPYDPKGETDALAAFDTHFDELSEGLKEMSLSQMAMRRGREVGPGLLTLPMEFTAIKPALRTFIATLFEENPYQFKPVFRGFYFTSALQEGVSVQHASERIARQFSLRPRAGASERAPMSDNGHFLLGLFRKVIFADKQLVKQYSSPGRNRLRQVMFLASFALLGLCLAGWGWSYTSNKQLVANSVQDLRQAKTLQEGRFDVQSRIQALLVLQTRLEDLRSYRDKHPLSMGLGLYQGDRIEKKVREEYFHGMRQLMLAPVQGKLEAYLNEVLANRAKLKVADAAGAAPQVAAQVNAGQTLYQDASPTDANDAYNALKTYLMLADRSKVESSHLSDQLTRFWRRWLDDNRGTMSREELARSAERLMAFYVSQYEQPNWPTIDEKFALVSDSRNVIKGVMKGTPARDRVYDQIKQRASVRFAQITVASLIGEENARAGVAGSYRVSGAFSRKAYEDYVKDAIKQAANEQLSATDWVLADTVQGDLTLSGSPEHIARELTQMYKAEYAQEWRKFMQGVTVTDFGNFDQAVTRMNAIGDPQNSPLRKVLEAVNNETIWDNPEAANKALGVAKKGIVEWFNRTILRRQPSGMNVQVDPNTGKQVAIQMGPVGAEFAGLSRLFAQRDGGAPMINGYFEAMGKLRSRLNGIKTQGDPGPGARKLMQETLERGSGSEIFEIEKIIDEQMLNGLNESQRDALRPLLVRPLMQTFAALIRPTEGEINRTWVEQVYQPFEDGIGKLYPYNPGSSAEATQADRDAVFGASGSISKFGSEALGALVIRRGSVMTPQQWANMGVSLRPEFTSNYSGWVGGASGGGRGDANAGMVIEILPGAATGREYTITIDGQALRYRNEPPQWKTIELVNSSSVRIDAVTLDGRTVEVFNEPGSKGLNRLFSVANKGRGAGDKHFLMSVNKDDATVDFELRIIRVPVRSDAQTETAKPALRLPREVAGAPPAAVAPAATGMGTGTGTAPAAPATTPAAAPAGGV